MKLSKLIIKNFRGIKGNNNIIDFANSNIIFLIGQNNIGKSTILRAYEFFTNSKQTALMEDFNNYETSSPIEIEGWFIKEEGDESDKDLSGSGKTAEPDWVSKWVSSDGFIKIRKTWSKAGVNFKKETYSPSQNNWVENGFGGMDSLFSKYAPTPIAINAMENETTLEEKVNKLMQDNFLKKIRDEHGELCKDIVSKISELQNKITSSESVASMNTDLNANFCKVFSDLKLKINASKEENIKFEEAFKKNHTISVEKEGNSRNESFLQNGHGVIRQALFNFIAFLNKNSSGIKKEYLILFEEPELFLHPKVSFALRESLYELSQNSPYQIICATHSPLMIDISKSHSSLIRVTSQNGETNTHQVGENVFSQDKERVQMINRFNPHICEAFYADIVLLVEGDTETIIYRDLLKRYYPTKEVFVLNTGTKNNIPFFQEVLTAFNITHYIIHDTDTEYDKNGDKNSAWTLNQKIWDKVCESNKIREDLARRYVHFRNFEDAHGISLSGNKDKPLKAFQFAQGIDRSESIPDCLRWLDDILGNKEILHDMDYIKTKVEK